MDHTAAPFIPRGYASQPPTQPLTPPLVSQPAPPVGPPGLYGGRGPAVKGYPPPPPPNIPPHFGGYHQPQMYGMPPPPQYSSHAAAMPPPPAEPPAYRAPTKLRAVANEYIPGQKKPAATGAEKHADPTATAKSGEGEAAVSPKTELKLNAAARPYSPNRGAPTFPTTAPATEPVLTPNTENTQGGDSATFPTGNTPEPMTPVTPMSPTRDGTHFDTFKNSKLPVPATPKAPAEVKLNSTWTLYADSHPITMGIALGGGFAKPDPAAVFAPTLLKTISDMEGFWRLWRTIKPPSAQAPSFSFFFFRRTINPTWEDARNKAGGTVNVPLWDASRAGLLERDQVDDVWFIATMLLAGESLPGANVFNGAVLKIRTRNITLQLWTNTCQQASIQPSTDAFRERLTQRFPQDKFDLFEFFSHGEKTPASPVTAKPSNSKAKKVPAKREPDFRL